MPDLQTFFSDTTEDYITPSEPDLYDWVTIRLRVGRGQADACFLVTRKMHLHMKLSESDGLFDYYAVRFEITSKPLRYYFEIASGGRTWKYTRRGVRNTIRPADWWHILPGFHTPRWAQGAVMYQIFVDRFCNGDPSNDVYTGEYRYEGKPVVQVRDWDRPPSNEGYREFYGGDLQGVIDKLDYLADLGIEAIYFNPIFLSPSSHKYDTQDYDHIDPHFGRIVRDVKEEKKPRRNRTNRSAQRYLKRVTDPANLAASDRLFAELVQKAHARGIRVILDGVFNHCGSWHRWMDAERIYEQTPRGKKGAHASKRSPYTGYFRFGRDAWPGNRNYDAWWNFGTLPKLNYEGSEELCKEILRIGKKWVSPPYNADGWRLDVAADLGYSPEFNHHFWKRFREAVRKANPEAIVLAENYEHSQNWLQGEEWDTIMNYEFFLEPVTWFLTGMEKHSDARIEEKYGDPDTFWHLATCRNESAIPEAALRISMNQLSNHDHSRFLTRTNRLVGRAHHHGFEAALDGTHMEVMRQAVLLQMTWTGAPTIYYGDEAGMGGFTDPDNRRTFPWGHEDQQLIAYHKLLISLRRKSPALRRGSLLRLPDNDGILAYARFCRNPETAGNGRTDGVYAHARFCRNPGTAGNGRTNGRTDSLPDPNPAAPVGKAGSEAYVVVLNINYIPIEYEADLTYAGIPADAELDYLLRTDRGGYVEPAARLPLRAGMLRLTLPPESGFLFRWRP
ncbi:MAG: glycoside hydrolase family 13 protein [Eubacteriales bacterium]|nr:glycoside hydrolase family 13 protein [Eubacteriales bacterium]